MVKIYDDASNYIRDMFWSKSHNKNNTLNIEEAVHAKLVHDNENKDPEYYKHKAGVVHVTSLSKCLRGVVLGMLGNEKDILDDRAKKDQMRKLGIFKAGNLFEDFIVDALGDKMLDRQTEYVYNYKNIIVTGRDDGTILHDGKTMVLENKSVNSQAFWRREKEGTLVSTHNQAQLQTYLWLRRILPNLFFYDDEIVYSNMEFKQIVEYKGWDVSRVSQRMNKPDNSDLNGIFCYISKDDCTISQAPIKFNQDIIDEVVIPAMDIIAYGYEKQNAMIVPVPNPISFDEVKHQHQKNWLCTYCEYHNQCAGKGWILEAEAEIKRLNLNVQLKMNNKYAVVKDKPLIVATDIG